MLSARALLLLYVCTTGPSTSAQAQFAAALAAYDAGQYEAAASAFDALQAAGMQSGWIAFDLGNSQLRAGKVGPAVAAYRRALVDLPRQSDIRANLAFARRRVPDAIAPPEPQPLLRSVFFWHYVLNGREAMWGAALCTALTFGLRIPPLFGRLTRVLRGLSTACATLAVALGLSVAVHLFRPTRVGVVLSDEVDVLTINEPGAPVRFRLHAGAETEVQAELDGWLLLALSDGKQGWVRSESVAQIAQ
jgi:tetratricopeptide (TPR) repeat protein